VTHAGVAGAGVVDRDLDVADASDGPAELVVVRDRGVLRDLEDEADLLADIKNVLLPAWHQKTPRSPKLFWCNSPCTEDVTVVLVQPGDTDVGNAFAATVQDGGNTPGEPMEFIRQTLKVKDATFDHPCGEVDDGCYGVTGNDDRTIISHEIGHSLGLGHCDINYGVMCHVRPSLGKRGYRGDGLLDTSTAGRSRPQGLLPLEVN
jgi:hypothetical protein